MVVTYEYIWKTATDLASFAGKHAIVNAGRAVSAYKTLVNDISTGAWSVTSATRVRFALDVRIGGQQRAMSRRSYAASAVAA